MAEQGAELGQRPPVADLGRRGIVRHDAAEAVGGELVVQERLLITGQALGVEQQVADRGDARTGAYKMMVFPSPINSDDGRADALSQ